MNKESKFAVCALGLSSALMGGVIIYQMSQINDMAAAVDTINKALHQSARLSTKRDNDLRVVKIDLKKAGEKLNRTITDLRIMQEFYNYDTAKVTFNPDDVTLPSNATVYHMQKALYNTELYDLSEAYVVCEREYGINAIALASLTIEETEWGTSQRAVRDNNMSGYAVYSDASKGVIFSSRSLSLIKTAELLRNDYLTEGAKYYNGLSIADVNTKYCYGDDGEPDYDWSKSITSIGNDLVNKINK